MMAPERARVVSVLGAEECRRLLASKSIGRIGVNRRGHGPLVVPVNYVLDSTGAVVFRTEVGTKLAGIHRGAVTFEVDDLDEATRTGWSVVVDGLAHEIDADCEAAVLVDPWSDSRLRHAVRLVPSTITGRRVG
jgi:nitroimidazol reductase NimA-like FMN-containing flavoprotein (pyridoxamine 5'-phosphate oxidase superfamily)